VLVEPPEVTSDGRSRERGTGRSLRGGKRGNTCRCGGSWETLTNLPFPGGYPAAEAAATLWDELLFQRAVQVYLWALPAMNLDAMRRAQESEFGTGGNVLAVWKDRIDANTVVLTANPDVIYALAWLDLDRDGPTVVEAPAGLQGCWMMPGTAP